MKLFFIVAASGLILAGAAMAQDKPVAPTLPTGAATPPPTQAPTAAMSADAKRAARDAEVICYNDFDVGSHVKHTRVCMTRRQHDDLQHDSAQALEDLRANVPQPPLKGGFGH